jgi:hypothetical protein
LGNTSLHLSQHLVVRLIRRRLGRLPDIVLSDDRRLSGIVLGDSRRLPGIVLGDSRRLPGIVLSDSRRLPGIVLLGDRLTLLLALKKGKSVSDGQ